MTATTALAPRAMAPRKLNANVNTPFFPGDQTSSTTNDMDTVRSSSGFFKGLSETFLKMFDASSYEMV